jgi:hypothetical protein
MKVYNKSLDKIMVLPSTIDSNGVLYTSKMSTEDLVELGYYPIKLGSIPNRRYYNYAESKELVGNEYLITYQSTPKNLFLVQESMFRTVKDTFKRKLTLPRVMTPLGYPVDGARVNKDDFQSKHDKMIRKGELTTTVKDSNNEYHVNTPVGDLLVLVDAITDNYENLLGTKWYKENEIMSLTTVEQCVKYERSFVRTDPEFGDIYENKSRDW